MGGRRNCSAGNAGSRTPRSGQIFENEREELEELGRRLESSKVEKKGMKRMQFTKKGLLDIEKKWGYKV